MVSYCSFVARERQIETEIAREFERDPVILTACAAEKKQLRSQFCMSSRSVLSTREEDVEVNGISCGKVTKIEAPDFGWQWKVKSDSIR